MSTDRPDHAEVDRRWRESDQSWLVAEKLYIDTPFFQGEVVVEDVQIEGNAVIYSLVSLPPPGSVLGTGCFYFDPDSLGLADPGEL